jgi:hypothetical protein
MTRGNLPSRRLPWILRLLNIVLSAVAAQRIVWDELHLGGAGIWRSLLVANLCFAISRPGSYLVRRLMPSHGAGH